MENWYYDMNDIKNSPSLKDGVDSSTESRYRTEGVKFITAIGQKIGLRYITTATGTVYFHRFFMKQSFKEYNRYAMAAACLFLAGKVEETPKKARDIFKTIQAHGLLTESAMTAAFGDDPKEELMTMERMLLKTIKFDLQVDHPYKFVLKVAKTFVGDRSKIEKVVQNCWGFINDSLSTTLCLQWEPEIVAIALTDLACRITRFEITDWQNKSPGDKGKWWDQYVSGVSVDLLESICHQVLDLYSAPGRDKGSQSSSSSSSSSSRHESSRRQNSDGGPPAKQNKLEQSQQSASTKPTQIGSHGSSHAPSPLKPMSSYPAATSSSYTSSQNDKQPPGSSTSVASIPPGYGAPSSFAGYSVPPPTHPPIPPSASGYQQPSYYPPSVTQPPPAGYYGQASVTPTRVPPPHMAYGNYPPPHAYPPQQQMQPSPHYQRRSSSLRVLTDNQ